MQGNMNVKFIRKFPVQKQFMLLHISYSIQRDTSTCFVISLCCKAAPLLPQCATRLEWLWQMEYNSPSSPPPRSISQMLQGVSKGSHKYTVVLNHSNSAATYKEMVRKVKYFVLFSFFFCVPLSFHLNSLKNAQCRCFLYQFYNIFQLRGYFLDFNGRKIY